MIFVLLIITNGFTPSYCAKGHLPIIEYSNYIKIPETINVHSFHLPVFCISTTCLYGVLQARELKENMVNMTVWRYYGYWQVDKSRASNYIVRRY